MEVIRGRAYARAGLAGNPSDGYYGKTLAVSVPNFSAVAVLYEWPTLEILPSKEDHVRFNNLDELSDDVQRNGYYGGLRLVKASLKKFADYCREYGITLPRRNFSIRYETDVPRQVGLAGSSAIIVATFRALMQFYEIEIDEQILPNWILATERDELGISAGLQDRVCLTYEGLVYMDFAREKMERDGFGTYVRVDPQGLPPLYIAYQTRLAEMSEVVHNNLRERWERGDKDVVAAMQGFGELTEEARTAVENGDAHRLAAAIDANFDLRCRIVNISEGNLRMVRLARECGASAKFAGSGGAIVGTCPDESVFNCLQGRLAEEDCRVLRVKPLPSRVVAGASPAPGEVAKG